MELSAFAGGDSRTAFSTAGICSIALAVPVVVDAVNRSERIEYAACERYGFPNRGRVKSVVVMGGIAFAIVYVSRR
jgi:PII-like signaling protein